MIDASCAAPTFPGHVAHSFPFVNSGRVIFIFLTIGFPEVEVF